MFTKRIIPCLLVDERKILNDKKFEYIINRDFSKLLGPFYNKAGADEIIFYDIKACDEDRKTSLEFLAQISKNLDIPFYIGGGVNSIYDFSMILKHGAKKVLLNSSAVKNPGLIKQASLIFGSESIVLYIDTKKNINETWDVYTKGGKVKTNINAVEWAQKAEELGAGEIIINILDVECYKKESIIELIYELKKNIKIPVIVSSTSKKLEDFYKIVKEVNIDGILTTSNLNIDDINITN